MVASGNPAVRPLAMICNADACAVAAVVAATRGFAAALVPGAAARLAIVAEELVSNLIDHAAMPAGAMIEFALAVEAGRVWMTLSDPAAAFDPRSAPETAIPSRGGSAGLALVRAWVVIESYERVGDRNVLRVSLPAGLPG